MLRGFHVLVTLATVYDLALLEDSIPSPLCLPFTILAFKAACLRPTIAPLIDAIFITPFMLSALLAEALQVGHRIGIRSCALCPRPRCEVLRATEFCEALT